jgi:hypothetical protein
MGSFPVVNMKTAMRPSMVLKARAFSSHVVNYIGARIASHCTTQNAAGINGRTHEYSRLQRCNSVTEAVLMSVKL